VPDLRRRDLRRRAMETSINKFVAMQQKMPVLTIVLLICVMLHCTIKWLYGNHA
jgi:hypothetical protein